MPERLDLFKASGSYDITSLDDYYTHVFITKLLSFRIKDEAKAFYNDLNEKYKKLIKEKIASMP